MLTRSTRDAERVLARLDPTADASPAVSDAERAAILAAILAIAVVPRRRRVPVRRLVLASTALVATVVAVVFVRAQPQPAYAATPPMLHYVMPVDAVPAPELLLMIATAARLAAPRGRGPYEYTHTRYWTLESPLTQKSESWSLSPGEMRRWWRTDDGSGRISVRDKLDDEPRNAYYGPRELPGPPLCPPADPASPPQPDCPIEVLEDPAAFAYVLGLDGRTESMTNTGRVSPLGSANHLAWFRVPTPLVLASLWTAIAGIPGITYAGRVTDRAGRNGEAFSMEFDAGLGPAVDTIIADPVTGAVLGFERTLKRLTNPEFMSEKLPVNIRTPAVVDYWVVVRSERRETTT